MEAKQKLTPARLQLIRDRRATRALATEALGLGRTFPVPGLYFVRELGKTQYQQGTHHQYAIVNWRPNRQQVWLEEATFTIDLTPLLNPIAEGPKNISYASLVNQIIRVEYAGRRSQQSGSRVHHADIADWKVMEKFDLLDVLIKTPSNVLQLAVDADLANWDEDAYMNGVIEDSLLEDLPDYDQIDYDPIPDDEYDILPFDEEELDPSLLLDEEIDPALMLEEEEDSSKTDGTK